MNIPDDLQMMYNHCLELASKDVEKISFSTEMMLALIERIGDLETDSLNFESYVHYECRKKLKQCEQEITDLKLKLEVTLPLIVTDTHSDGESYTEV